ASPDVIINHKDRTLEMYYHGPVPQELRPEAQAVLSDCYPFGPHQSTRLALSRDGQTFTDGDRFILPFYSRAFDYNGYRYQLTMPGMIYRSRDANGPYEFGNWLFNENFRHG